MAVLFVRNTDMPVPILIPLGRESEQASVRDWRGFIIYGRKTGRTDEGDYGTVRAGGSGAVYFGKIYKVPESNVAVSSLQF